MTDFLPQGYEKPASASKYYKMQKGANKFRIMSSAIVGWIDWDKSGERPVPVRTQEQPEKALDPMQGYKHFWAFVIFDYKDGEFKIMEITQASIQDSIIAIQSDEAWGSPTGYDLNITRTGDNLETKYTVMPSPKVELPKEIIDRYIATPINLNALWSNGDPFEVKDNAGVKPVQTQPVNSVETMAKESFKTPEQSFDDRMKEEIPIPDNVF